MKSHSLSKLIPLPGLGLAGCTSVPTEFELVTPFKELSVDHSHVWQDGSHPFSAAAVIDMDGDGRHEVFFGGGKDLRNIIEGSGLSDIHASYAAASIDIDNDGDVDLLVAQNYIKSPLHKLFKLDGLTSLQTRDGRFAHLSTRL